MNSRKTATILAALRLYQRYADQPALVRSVATDDGTLQALSATEIDALCEEINCASIPTVVVDMHGSAIYSVNASEPVRLILLDQDIESTDRKNLAVIDGVTAYVHDFVKGEADIKPGFVEHIAKTLQSRAIESVAPPPSAQAHQ